MSAYGYVRKKTLRGSFFVPAGPRRGAAQIGRSGTAGAPRFGWEAS